MIAWLLLKCARVIQGAVLLVVVVGAFAVPALTTTTTTKAIASTTTHKSRLWLPTSSSPSSSVPPTTLSTGSAIQTTTTYDTSNDNAAHNNNNDDNADHDRRAVVVRPPLNPNCWALVSALEHKIGIVPTMTTTTITNCMEQGGLGAVTWIRIPCGAWVGEYTGELWTRDQVKVRYKDTNQNSCWNDDHDDHEASHDHGSDNGNDDQMNQPRCVGWQEDEVHDWMESRIRRNQGRSGDYLFHVGDDYYLDGEDSDKSGWCRFINHAKTKDDDGVGCHVEEDPCNLEAKCTREIWNGECFVPPRLWFVARRDIAPGEELLFDYGDSYWNQS